MTTGAILTLFLLAAPPGNDDCLSCHGDRSILSMSKEERAQMVFPPPAPAGEEPKYKNTIEEVSPFVSGEKFISSIHGLLLCTDCHADASGIPHRAILKAVRCAQCHADKQKTFDKSIHARGFTQATAASPLCQDCHGAHEIRKASDPLSSVYPTRLPKTCAGCHADEELVKREKIAIPQPYKAYVKSIHGRALLERGVLKAATCTSCHGSHDIRASTDPLSLTFKANVPKTCSACHYGVYRVYMESVHGEGYFGRHAVDSPVCTNCHGEHNIQSPKEPESTVYAAAISKTTCPQCHGVERIVKKYGLPAERITTYLDSYHGLADRFGDTTVANCASCHGIHDIFPSSDTRSLVNKANLATTCGKCHPGATANFAVGLVHGTIRVPGKTTPEVVKYYVKFFYIILIVLIIGGMAAHNGLDYLAELRAGLRRTGGERLYVRMTASERAQHMVLFITFTILAVTGFALRFKWGLPFLSGETNLFIRKYTHRTAAAFFIAAGAWHLFYLIFRQRGRQLTLAMMPTFKDITDAVRMLRYYLGTSRDKARFGRFSYAEKMEYLALLWGGVVMIITGSILWFEDFAMKFIPKWGVDIADLVHLFEAILATLAVIVWHFYHVHWKPQVSPMNTAWLTGEITEEQMREEHPLELEEIKEEKR